MSDTSQLILRRMIVYLQDVEHNLRHEILTEEEIATVNGQIEEIKKHLNLVEVRMSQQMIGGFDSTP